MRFTLKYYWVIVLLAFCFAGVAQTDTTRKNSLSFDLGITRGHNINLWPFFKKYRNQQKKELQVLYPFFSSRRNFVNGAKHSHLLPLYVADSSSKGKDLRILSFYYPSVLRFSTQRDSSGVYKSFKFLELAPHISLMGYSKSPRGLSVENNFFFFIWYRKDVLQQKTKFVVFPSYWYFSSTKDTTNVLFPVYFKRNKAGSQYLNVLGIYNQRNTLFEKKKSLFPLWWHTENYSPTDTVKKTVLFPLYWNNKSRDESRVLFFPLSYSSKTKYYQSFTLFPLYSEGRSRDSSSSYRAITPFLWNVKNKWGTTATLFPVYWHTKRFYKKDTVTRNILFPLVWTSKSHDLTSRVYFPLVYSFKDKYSKSFTFFPLFSFGRDFDSSGKYLAVTPLFWHIRKKDAVKNFFVPIYWNTERFYKDDTVRREIIFPFYWTYRSKTENNNVVFPILFSYKNSYRSSITVLPFFSYGTNNDQKSGHLVITPLYWKFWSKYGEHETFFPLYWSKKEYYRNDTVTSKTLFPIFWSTHRKNSSVDVLFPFVWKFKDRYYKSFTLFPLFSTGRDVDSSGRKHLAVTPFYWKFDSKNGSKQFIFPFYWARESYRKEDTIHRRAIFPIYWLTWSSKKRNTVVFPFVFNLKNTERHSLTVFPFFSYGHHYKDSSRKYFAVTPLFWHTQKRDKITNTFFPVYWNSTKYYNHDTVRREVIFPLYWTRQSKNKYNAVFFPLVFNHKDEYKKSFTFFPFYSHGQHLKDTARKYFAITPFFWHQESKNKVANTLFPFYWNRVKYLNDDTIRREVIFPFVWTKRSKNEYVAAFVPLVFYHKDIYKQSFTFFPLFSSGHSTNNRWRYLAITPLFWHTKTRYGSTDMFIPLFFKHKEFYANDTSVRTVVFPIYWSYRDKDEKRNVLFPLVFSRENNSRKSLTVFPLFSYGNNKKNGDKHLVVTPLFWHIKNKEHVRDVFFPFYWQHKHITANDTSVRQFFFPLYWHRKDKSGVRSAVFPLVFRTKTKNKNSFTFIPLVSFAKKPDSSNHLVVTTFFWHFKNKRGVFNTLFPLYWGKTTYLKNDTTKTNIVFPLYWSHKSKTKKYNLLLPFIYRQKDTGYKSFTFIPFVSSGKSINGKRSHLMLTPLFGRFKHDKGTNTFLFPLFNHRRDSIERHFSALLFLYRQTRSAEYTRTSFLWPICAYEREKQNKKFRFAPIVWYSKTDTSKMFSIQPLFYNFKTNERKTFILSAFLYKRDNVIGKSISNSILWRAYYSKKYANGDFERRFIHLLIANVKVDGRREKAFLPFFHTIKESNGDRSKSFFFGMYNRFKEYKPEIKDFYEEERVLWFIRLRSNYKQLKAEGKVNFVRKRQGRKAAR